ncbi:hypothetical protein PM082_008276 [Marasmius tenuissimus]|nr:hypothetical protein PM082_008276 [Marasmius tenuissimus]
MSSSYPPQLHLTLPTNTTSFKRSFDQFGFDLDSPVGNAEAGSSSSGSHGAGSSGSRNERNKRPRSTSSLSDGGDSLSSGSTFASGSSDTSLSEGNEPEAGPSTSTTAALSPNRSVTSHILGAMSFEPPRLPTPDIQDIEMPDYPLNGGQNEVEGLTEPTSSSESPGGESTTSSEHSYSTSLERLDDLESQTYNVLSPRSSVPRPPTPPPTLPPLSLPDDQTPLHANVMPFLENASLPSPALSGGRTNTTPSLSAAHVLNSYHAIATRGPSSQTGVVSRSSDPDPIPAADPTGGRYSLSDSLEQLLNRDDLSSFDLDMRRPTRTDSSSGLRNRSSFVAPRVDFSDTSGSSSHPTSFPFMPSTSFVRRSGSLNSAPTRSESPWRQMLNVHMPNREQERSQPSRPPANRENSASQYLHSSRESPSLTLNTHPTTPLNPFSYRIPPSSSRPELPLPPRRQSSSTSNSADLARWFEHTDNTDSPNREHPLFGRERASHRTGAIGGMATDDDHAEPHFRVYSSAVDDYESTVPGLRARVMENRRSSANAEPNVRRQHRAPPSLESLMARESEETSESELRDLPGESRRRRYIEQGLLDPRETAARSYEEGVFPSTSNVTPLHQSRADERRWRFSWTNPFADLDDEDDPTPLSESERIYRASRRLSRPVPRPLSTSDRGQSFPDLFLPGDNIPGVDISTGTARPRRYRSRYSGVLAGSTSLFSENAAELRRRNDRELIDRLRRASNSGDYNWGPPSDDEFDGEVLGTRTSFGRAGGNMGGSHTDTDPWSPVLPPLSHHRPRSPSPPVMPRAMTELLSQSERPSRHHSVAVHHPRSSRSTQGMSNVRRNNTPWYLNTEIPRHDLMESYDVTNPSWDRSREPQQAQSAYVSRFSDDYSRRYGTRPSRSPSRGDHSAPTTRSPRWSSFDESRRDSPAIFDSQSSSISDIARTITSNDYALSLFSHTPDISSADLDAEMVTDTSEVYSPPNPPSIPPLTWEVLFSTLKIPQTYLLFPGLPRCQHLLELFHLWTLVMRLTQLQYLASNDLPPPYRPLSLLPTYRFQRLPGSVEIIKT